MHSNLLIVLILTVGFALASFFAYVMQRLGLPSILGYLLAGFIIGPYSPGFVADAEIAKQLAEIGVILMLFGVGLHFKIEDLIRVKSIAIPGALIQTLVATVFATLIVYGIGWSIEAGVIIGLSIGVASTVVLVRLLTDNDILNTSKGHIAVGWLVVEDIFTVIILILLPTLASFSGGMNLSLMGIAEAVLFVIFKFFVLVIFMFTWGHRVIGSILTNIARLRSQELFTLTILALVFLIATGSSVIFGTSIALGAFIAGMVIGKTNVKHQAAANALPLKDIFAVIFFLSVGMLFHPGVIVTNLTLFLGIIAVILIMKPLSAYLITVFLGYSLNTALTVAISLAQIGEFSFILAEEALSLKMIPEEGLDILVACAFISISLNPLLFQMIGSLESMIKKFSSTPYSQKDPVGIRHQESSSSKVMIVGYGPIGKEVSKIVKSFGYVPVIIEQNIDTVSSVEEMNTVVFGDAVDPNILKSAQVEEVTHLIITIPDTDKVLKIILSARQLNPKLEIVARIQYTAQKPLLQGLNVKTICSEIETLGAFASLTRRLFQSKEAFFL